MVQAGQRIACARQVCELLNKSLVLGVDGLLPQLINNLFKFKTKMSQAAQAYIGANRGEGASFQFSKHAYFKT